jgi:hypothetical protein
MMRKFHTCFTEKNLTGNAGLLNIGKFAKKLKLPEILDEHLNIERASNAEYQVNTVVMMLIFGVLAGAKHMNHMEILRADEVMRQIFKWEKFPVLTTFGRIFKLFTQKYCKELSDAETGVRKKVWRKKWYGKLTLDMDSSVRGVYGEQEGVAKGYNPKKKGQSSYHPLFCFIAENRECLHNWFRTGSAYSANGSIDFMKECFAKLPKHAWKIFVRADSAFFDGDLLDFLESKGSQYLIKVKMKGLTGLLEKQSWRKIKGKPGYESSVFEHKCAKWKKSRTFVAVRYLTEVRVEKNALFGTEEYVYEYEYFCYVSNLKLSPWATHKKYGQRATSENWLDWCKGQMASGSILTQKFWANSAIFQTSILAYNLLVWMMWLNNKGGFNEEPNTIRMFLIHVPARLVTRSNQCSLRLSKNYSYKDRWLSLENSIEQLNFS